MILKKCGQIPKYGFVHIFVDILHKIGYYTNVTILNSSINIKRRIANERF